MHLFPCRRNVPVPPPPYRCIKQQDPVTNLTPLQCTRRHRHFQWTVKDAFRPGVRAVMPARNTDHKESLQEVVEARALPHLYVNPRSYFFSFSLIPRMSTTSPPYWAQLYVDHIRRPIGFSVVSAMDLEQYLQQYGAFSIRKMILLFLPTPATRHLFPYGIHNMVLIRSCLYPLLFTIQFYHHVTSQNVCIELPREQQQADYDALSAFLYQSPILTHHLAARILYPFPVQT